MLDSMLLIINAVRFMRARSISIKVNGLQLCHSMGMVSS